MFKHLALCFMLMQLTVTNNCTDGCLRCQNTSATDTTKICVLCDTSRNFYLDSNACVLSKLTNCQLISSTGDCLACNKNYYLTVSTTEKNSCVAVETANLITNCAAYSSATTCAGCSTGYYLSDNACVNTDLTTIANCLYYSSATKCSSCKEGYDLN